MGSGERETAEGLVRVSWAGSQGVYAKSSTPLCRALLDNTVGWRKKGTSFPVHVRLPVAMVPFSAGPAPSEALAHLYFLDSADVDEYRSRDRGRLVEWFAGLRDAGIADWLIVFDSARARESRARAALLEKLKSDFSKYIPKLVEVESETGKITTLVKGLKDVLILSLDAWVCREEAEVAREKEKGLQCRLYSMVERQMRLSRLYGQLGLQEQVLAQLDELDAYLGHLLSSAEVREAPWASELGKASSHCPVLVSRPQAFAGEAVTLGQLRCVLLSEKAALLRARCGEGDEERRRSGAEMLLGYAAGALECWEEERRWLPGGEASDAHVWVFEAALCLASLSAAAAFTDPANIRAASHATSALWTRLCRRLAGLGSVLGFVGADDTATPSPQAEELRRWLGEKTAQQLSEALGSWRGFGEQFRKVAESGVAVLKHFGRRRESRLLGGRLGDVMVSRGEPDVALPHFRRLLRGLAQDGWAALETAALLRYFPLFHAQPAEQISFALTLATEAPSKDLRQDFFARFLALSQDNSLQVVEEKESLFAIRSIVTTPLQSGPKTPLKASLKLHSFLPGPVTVALAVFLEPVNSNGGPVSYFVEKEGESVRLMASELQSRRARRQASLSPPAPPDQPPTFRLDSLTLEPGPNTVSLEAPLGLEVAGEWVVGRLELELGRARVSVLGKGHGWGLFHVVEEQPRLDLLTKTALHNGVPETLALRAHAPATLAFPAHLTFSSKGIRFALLSTGAQRSWSEELEVSLDLAAGECREVSVLVLCARSDCGPESAEALESLTVQWGEFRWDFALSFKPALFAEPRITVLEEKTLLVFQVSAARAGITLSDATAKSEQLKSGPRLLSALEEGGSGLEVACPVSLVWEWGWAEVAAEGEASGGRLELGVELTYSVEGEEGLRYGHRVAAECGTGQYELCSQIRAKPALCRAETECAMVVSLRGLSGQRRSESVLLSLASPLPGLWRFPEPTHVVAVKESGLGQASLPLVPLAVGYLPLPSLSLRLLPAPDARDGPPLLVYERNAGRQVHVLAPLS